MDARPSMSDIVPGVGLAGPSEAAWPTSPNLWPAQAAVSIKASTVVFKATGHVFAWKLSADGWWVMNLPGQQRAHTRLQLDAKTGGETWLLADWAGGLAQRVVALNFVKTTADAGFGTVKQASRMWQYGGSVDTRTPFFHYLYTNGTGERVQKDLDAGTESRTPIPEWDLDGADLWERWDFPDQALTLTRRWTPVSNHGTKVHWVLERYDAIRADEPSVLIPSRVNYLVDTGKAVPPTAVSSASRRVSSGFDQPRPLR